jgi:pyrimidine-nucleoside phosphorylase
MNMYQILQKKKEKKPLSKEEISFFVQGFTKGEIPDYQASALLMAICLNGMNEEETAILTEEMMHSGDTVDLSEFGEKSVDKHSTGGVGDKTTLILAPIVAAAGGVVAKMSGRGLGHTGGTVDKMESIPGMRVALSSEEFFSIVKKSNLSVIGQTGNLAPADKKLYALRDVTATIDSVPLIASSIMSKKLASGAKSIVLDVKYGSGAFMKTAESARALAREMVAIGKKLGRKVVAFITDMDSPLGLAIGNALEVKEAAQVLQGKGDPALTSLCLLLSARMISLSLSIPLSEAEALANEVLSNGKAFQKMKEWVSLQGGDSAALEDFSLLPQAACSEAVIAPKNGFLSSMNTEKIGLAAGSLGAGRKVKEDRIDYSAGILLHKKTGDFAEKGETIATLYASDPSLFSQAKELFLSAITLAENKPILPSLIEDVIE